MENENPYQTGFDPAHDEGRQEAEITSDGAVLLPGGQRRGLVGHVSICGSLMIAQGVLDSVFGIGLIVMSIWLPNMLAAEMQKNPAIQQGNGMDANQLSMLITVMYGGMGALLVVISLVSIVGGIKMIKLQSYVFCIVAVAASFFTLFAGCYCFPTSLGIGIYALFVLLNDSVKLAFELTKRGATSAQVKAAFRELP